MHLTVDNWTPPGLNEGKSHPLAPLVASGFVIGSGVVRRWLAFPGVRWRWLTFPNEYVFTSVARFSGSSDEASCASAN